MYSPALVPDGGSTPNELSGRRSRIMNQLRENLKQHPAIEHTQFEVTRNGSGHELVGVFDTLILANGRVDTGEAKLTINWWTHPPDIENQFIFHYSEPIGFDCGWHRQPHPGESDIPFDHFQYRFDSDEEYQYQGVDFIEDNPVGLFWEVAQTRLPKVLEWRWDD